MTAGYRSTLPTSSSLEMEAMLPSVLLLALVAPPPAVTPPAKTPPLADLHPPIALGSTRPDDSGPYFFADSLLGPGTGVWPGSGWKFADGSVLEVASDG